jgi:hypothetical protein
MHEGVIPSDLHEAKAELEHLAKRMHITANFNEQHMRTLTYSEIFVFMKTEQAMKSAGDFLETFFLCCCAWFPMEREGFCRVFHLRMFIAAFPIRLHPDRCFLERNEEATRLGEATHAMLQEFDAIMDFFMRGGSFEFFYDKSRTFFKFVKDYYIKYNNWRKVDVQRMVQTIWDKLHELQGTLFQVAGECDEIDMQDPLVMRLSDMIKALVDRLVWIGADHEAFLFNVGVQAQMEQRRRLRLLREEQHRHAEDGFDFIEF